MPKRLAAPKIRPVTSNVGFRDWQEMPAPRLTMRRPGNYSMVRLRGRSKGRGQDAAEAAMERVEIDVLDRFRVEIAPVKLAQPLSLTFKS